MANSTKKFKFYEIPASLIKGNKFVKWTESNINEKNSAPVGVTLKVDDYGYILYWRDSNKKSDYLDISCIRDVRIGKYANVPKEKNIKDFFTGLNIEEKTLSVYYGYDFVNVQCINFVSVLHDADKIVKEWAHHLFECSISPRTQNLSPWEHLCKLRSILLYGKAVLDEKTREFCLPVQTIVDVFVTTDKQHMDSDRQHVYHMLQSVGLPCGKTDTMDEKTLTMDKFFNFFVQVVSKEDIDRIFFEYGTKKKLCMNAEQFQNFFNEKQRDPRLNELLYPYYTVEKAAEMILKFESDEGFKKKKQLSPQGLIRYLMDVENEVVDPVKYELNEDMEQPLCHYYINSSHNTYLTGHQVTGKAEVEIYRQVLLSGCRCIELDCWDDRNLDEPIITHGMTLCTQILFKDAVEAIKECAFKTSPYPVLLSFENHCSKGMQQKMAKYLVDILGDQLLIDPLSQYPIKSGVRLPSPEDLKYKILIKNKKTDTEKVNTKTQQKSLDQSSTQEDSTSNMLTSIVMKIQNSNQEQNAQNSNTSSVSAAVAAATPTATVAAVIDQGYNASNDARGLIYNNSQEFNKILQNLNKKNSFYNDDTSEASNLESLRSFSKDGKQKSLEHNASEFSSDKSDSEDDKVNFNINSSPEKTITAKEMSNLVNYLQPVDFQSFEIAEKRNRSYELSSFIETKAYNLHKEKSIEFVNYNKRQFSRIYPKSTRIASDNFIPQVYWNVGCQLVALNFQTLDVGMRLNQGKFEYNNRYGYLLKPEVMRRVDVNKSFDPFAESSLDGIVAATVTVQVISGIFFNDKHEKRVGHTVLVEMFGLPADTLKGQRAHRAKMNNCNTCNVVYGDSVYTFKKIIMPQLALLCFSALDEQNRLIGHRVLPIIGLRSGYRYICLKSESNQPLNMCMLFVNITVKDYVPDKFVELADALADPIRYISNLDKKEEMLKSLSDDSDVNVKEADSDISKKDTGTYELPKASSSCQLYSSQSNSITFNNNTPLFSNTGGVSIINNLMTSTNPSLQSYSFNDRFLTNLDKVNASNNLFGTLPGSMALGNVDKRKSHYDVPSTALNSLHNSLRSCSLNTTEHISIDMKKLGYINNSQLNDPNLFTEIDVEELKLNKSYVQMVKSYAKKFRKLEKDGEKKIADIAQSMNSESEKILNEAQKTKQKIEKEYQKVEKQASKRSSLNAESNLNEIKISMRHRCNSIDFDLNSALAELRDKKLKEMDAIYFETYKQIRELQISSLEPLFGRLEKSVRDIYESRMQTLKVITDKEISEVNKRVHHQIKYRKKSASKSSHDKDEYQRLSREIEKDSVSIAVSENTKIRELLKLKQKSLRQVYEKAFNCLKDQKEKQRVLYDTEFFQNYETKKKRLEDQQKVSLASMVMKNNCNNTTINNIDATNNNKSANSINLDNSNHTDHNNSKTSQICSNESTKL